MGVALGAVTALELLAPPVHAAPPPTHTGVLEVVSVEGPGEVDAELRVLELGLRVVGATAAVENTMADLAGWRVQLQGAVRDGVLTANSVVALARPLAKNGYGEYLLRIVAEAV